ncbi:MAG: hypothetical protein M0Z65_10455 [Firmicutes bacterium]|uniref:Tetratricopeptide repeat-containing protein n=1 Tax=Melghirimyces thermohalophilus TaxID=1236220 RepID=A0A1G6J742_9BACL|nr:hypothetical protein [Melghirimyces thermohalophilus]MDA8353580.1 hypothetical protein [Bacillota bacterium]SDC13736.1 hypothetical protein SAMN04488112_103182 [Melghirimyces thermohalophilus]
MFAKLLTKARELLKPSQSSATGRGEEPVTAADEEPAHNNSHSAEASLTYEEGDFRFSMPLDEEERQVVDEARKKYQEMKRRFGEGANAWEINQLKHFYAKQYWALQIFYRDRAQHFYKLRNEDPENLKKAIQYCQKQIAYAPMAIQANRMDPQAKTLPHHYGFKQLAIIREKQGDVEEAIRLCEEALAQGWKGDWQHRIDRYRKSLKK